MSLKKVGEWLWPESDTECQKVAGDMSSLKEAVGYCENFRVAVQAGGNVGIWPFALAGKFETVYTAEPDPDNFSCLCANVPQKNVFKLQCGFGSGTRPLSMNARVENCGAGYLHGPGDTPVIAIDSLALQNVDLIALDIEGMELYAIHGARTTIMQFHPVIMLEMKGHGHRYGYEDGEIEKYLSGIGYGVKTRIARDVIFTYQEK